MYTGSLQIPSDGFHRSANSQAPLANLKCLTSFLFHAIQGLGESRGNEFGHGETGRPIDGVPGSLNQTGRQMKGETIPSRICPHAIPEPGLVRAARPT